MMAAAELLSPAFGRPGGESAETAGERAIDLAHLSRQTFGDRALESEILELFENQARMAAMRLKAASADERKALAHGLKGSARSIGAFALGDAAAALEHTPTDSRMLKRLCERIDQVSDYISAITR